MARGVLVEVVKPGSPGHVSGILVGDRVLEVNGRKVDDHLDIRFHAASPGDLRLSLQRTGESLELTLPEQRYPLRGITFEEIKTKVCGSACIFCFIDQLPDGVRSSLKVKDEDYRLSFLHGNYMTLNTLKDRDIERIFEQRLSPLYVSIHSVDPDVRAKILGRPPKRELIPTIETLLSGGIELYGQVVLCPKVNDGAVLDETIEVLSGYHPGIKAIAVVPLGLSAHRDQNPLLSPVTKEVAGRALDQIHAHQERILKEKGTRFVWPGDEFFLKAERPLPDSDYYEAFDQYEDGIGMIRSFTNEFQKALAAVSHRTPIVRKLAIVTGTLFAKTLEGMVVELADRTGMEIRVIPVPNDFLGRAINVAGLLCGQDIARAIAAEVPGWDVAIPAEVVSRANGLLLDDWSPDRVQSEGNAKELFVVNGPGDLVRLLWEGRCEGAGTATYPHV